MLTALYIIIGIGVYSGFGFIIGKGTEELLLSRGWDKIDAVDFGIIFGIFFPVVVVSLITAKSVLHGARLLGFSIDEKKGKERKQ